MCLILLYIQFKSGFHIIHEIHSIEEYLQQSDAEPEAQGAPEVGAEVGEGQGGVERLRHSHCLVKRQNNCCGVVLPNLIP